MEYAQRRPGKAVLPVQTAIAYNGMYEPAGRALPPNCLPRPSSFSRAWGPQRAELLERLGLRTARDVLFFFPRDYEDLTDRREIADLEEGKLQSVVGVVEDVELRDTSAGGSMLGVLVRGGDGYLRALWFNQPFMRDRFAVGQRVLLSGKPKHEG